MCQTYKNRNSCQSFWKYSSKCHWRVMCNSSYESMAGVGLANITLDIYTLLRVRVYGICCIRIIIFFPLFSMRPILFQSAYHYHKILLCEHSGFKRTNTFSFIIYEFLIESNLLVCLDLGQPLNCSSISKVAIHFITIF